MNAPQRHRPAARIRANGKDITTLLLGNGADNAILVSLTITDEAGIKSDRLEIVLDNSRGFVTPPIGSEIEVALGYEPAPQVMGRFKLDSFTKAGPPSKLSWSRPRWSLRPTSRLGASARGTRRPSARS